MKRFAGKVAFITGAAHGQAAPRRAPSRRRWHASARSTCCINNAGICAYGLTHELSEEEWDAMIGVNPKGVWIVGEDMVKL